MGRMRCAVAFCIVACASTALAEPYPARPIRMIVTFPPGGSTDVIARAIQPSVEKRLGQPLIIENRPGGGGNIGVDAVAKAAPDGYTIGLAAAGALTITVSLNEKTSYDPLKDLTAITKIGESPFILAAHPSFPGNSTADVVALAKATTPDGLNIGHGGNGTAMHLTAELFSHMAGVKLTLVPYRGTGPVVSDLVAGHVPLGIVDAPSALALIRAGQIKAIAVTSLRRTAQLPDVPTLAEADLPGYESIGWYGIIAPAGVPAEIVARLNAAFVATLQEGEIAQRIRAVGSDPAPTTPAEFAAYISREIAKWSAVIERSGVRGN